MNKENGKYVVPQFQLYLHKCIHLYICIICAYSSHLLYNNEHKKTHLHKNSFIQYGGINSSVAVD